MSGFISWHLQRPGTSVRGLRTISGYDLTSTIRIVKLGKEMF